VYQKGLILYFFANAALILIRESMASFVGLTFSKLPIKQIHMLGVLFRLA